MKHLSANNSYSPTVWDFMKDVERLFDDSWTNDHRAAPVAKFQPKVDIKETADSFLIAADLPGMSKNQVNIDIDQGRLTISGERSEEKVADGGNSHRIERTFGRFERSFQLPTGVNEEQIQARLEDGVLEVLVPKPQIAKAKSVAIDGEKKGLFSKLLGADRANAAETTEEKH